MPSPLGMTLMSMGQPSASCGITKQRSYQALAPSEHMASGAILNHHHSHRPLPTKDSGHKSLVPHALVARA